MTYIEQYIRAAAIARNIDPDIAVRVARSEGGLSNPVRQSDVVKNGKRERSFGPFQLYMDGGLGSRALKEKGIDASNPAHWQAGVDYALDTAAREGWGQWYGARNTGIGNHQGIGKNARAIGVSLASNPYTPPGGFSSPESAAAAIEAAKTATPETAVAGTPPTGVPGVPGTTPGATSPLQAIAGALGGGSRQQSGPSDLNAIAPSGLESAPSAAMAAQAAALMQTLLSGRRKKYGVSLDGMEA
jgi:hypothetical protein